MPRAERRERDVVIDVVVLGIGSFGRLARRYLDSDGAYRVVAFSAHERFCTRDDLDGLPVLPFESLGKRHPPGAVHVFVGAGYGRVNRDRSEMLEEVRARGYEIATYVSSRAILWPESQLGEGCFVFENVTIQPDASVGRGVIIWSGSTVCHDSILEDFCFLASNVVVSGNVRLGHHTFAGANATFRDGVTTGAFTVVGAGAAILKDTAERSVHSIPGTPARGDDSLRLKRL